MKNSSDIGNRSREFPTCNAVTQPTAPPRAPKKETNILHKTQRRKVSWVNNIFRRNCFIKHVFGGTIEGTGRRGSGRKQPLDDLKETRRYCKLKEEASTRTLLRTHFGEGHGPVATQTTP
jgi:hypothetical protein